MIGMATVGMVVGFLGVAYARRGKPAAHMRPSKSASTWSATGSTIFGTGATMISSRLSSRISSKALTEFEGEEVSRAISVTRQPGEVPNGRNMHSEI